MSSFPLDLALPTNLLPPKIPKTTSGFTLLGSPIGPSSFVHSSLSNTISKLKPLLVMLFLALVSHCRNSVYLRTCNPVPLIPLYESFDSLMLSSLSRSIGAHLGEWSWPKASLPVSMGGLGLRKAAVHSAAVYYSSFHCSAPTLEDILGYLRDLSPLLDSCCHLLAQHSARSDWSSHQDIHVDTPIS